MKLYRKFLMAVLIMAFAFALSACARTTRNLEYVSQFMTEMHEVMYNAEPFINLPTNARNEAEQSNSNINNTRGNNEDTIDYDALFSKLIGSWKLIENISPTIRRYDVGDIITFYEDGTGSLNDVALEWSRSQGGLLGGADMLSYSVANRTGTTDRRFEIEDSTLTIIDSTTHGSRRIYERIE
ncbi:MAG: hypothetical protein FWE33_00615 [Defluviitaleaceae bacterium]|nr:hypothetical protein [Defluviitaleaceae bacterium]